MGTEFIIAVIVIFILLIILIAVMANMSKVRKEKKRCVEDNKKLYARVHKIDNLLKEQIHLKDNIAVNYDELKERYEMASRLAYTDSLTELPNKQQFSDICEGIMQGVEEGEDAALIVIRLANYDKIVSHAGSVVGDEFVYEFSKRLQVNLTLDDFLARTDKDEFSIITRISNNMTEYDNRMASLNNVLRQTIITSGQEILPKLYISCTKAPADGKSMQMLTLNARLALNKAELEDGARIYYYKSEMAAETMKHVELSSALSRITDDNGFQFMLKAQSNLKTGMTASYEITALWDTGAYGVMTPDEYLKYAEDTDIAKRIFANLFRRACNIQKQLGDAGYKDVSIIVPCFAGQFIDEEFAKIVYNSLEEIDVAPSRILIAVAEKVVLRNEAATIALMNKITKLGIGFVLDGFGDGSSSLKALVKAPVNMVRFSKGFLAGQTKMTDEQLLRSIVEMLHSWKVLAIVSGVDIKDDEYMLKKIKVDYAEGEAYKGYMSENVVLEHARVTQK